MLILVWVIAIALAGVVSAAIAGYGLVARIYARQGRTSLALGLGVYGAAILTTGVAGGYNLQVQTLFLLVGLASLWTYRSRALELLPQVSFAGRDRWWLVLPAVYYLTRFFSCGLPQQHGDPLYYHLSAPQLWVQLGHIELTPEHPSFSQAGLWEGFLGLPQIWLGTHGTLVRIVAQLFGQWMHLIWGQLGCLVLAAALLARLAPPLRARPALAIFLAWLATTQSAYEWTGTLAKNDYILAFFVLAAVWEALEEHWFLTGLLIGFAYSTKFLAVWAGLGLLVFLPWRKPMPVLGRAVLCYVLGGLFSVAPFLARNLIWTGNPVFPVLDDVLGPHWVSAWWMGHNSSFSGAPKLDVQMLGWFWNKMLEKALPKIVLVIGSAALLSEFIRRKPPKAAVRWLGLIAVPVVLMLVMLRPGADGRYGNFTAMLISVFLLAAVVREAFRVKALWAYGAPALLAMGLLINSPVDELVKVPKNYWFKPAQLYLEQFFPTFVMQEWVHANLAPEDRILFMGEKQQYYLDRPFETVVEMKKWEKLLTPAHDARALFSAVRGQGFRYIHFSPEAGGFPTVIRPYWPRITALSGQAVYSTSTALIFDLSKVSL